jgi:hypothetical protein
MLLVILLPLFGLTFSAAYTKVASEILLFWKEGDDEFNAVEIGGISAFSHEL